MRWFYQYFFYVLWAAFLVYWRLKAPGTKSPEKIEPMNSRVLRSVLFLAAIALFCVPLPVRLLYRPILPWGVVTFWTGAAMAVAGLLFAVWARVHLGANWSRSVTIKRDHELITSGPYALVRHPIYTGLLTAFLGSAIATAEIRGALAFVLVFFALWRKLRLEERWMSALFGQKWTNYAQRVPALVPRPM